MKRLILLLAASLILASPAFAWKEKVYRIEWSEWGLKDGMKSEQIAKQLDKNNVKYHKYSMRYNNYPFENAHFMIDSVSRWGITWDKAVIGTHGNKLACVYYTKKYPNKEFAFDIVSLLKNYFEAANGFDMNKRINDTGLFYKTYLFYNTTYRLNEPYYFEVFANKNIGAEDYSVEILLYAPRYNPWLM